jgi:16S rRNA (cytidine1402-2'-O)-methyltransferase
MTEKKRQILPSGLWVIATPIGNLSDLSPRARQALEESPVLLCEDTRRTRELLTALGISQRLNAGPKLVRFDAHASPQEVSHYLDLLKSGSTLGIVSDAGTPAVSDPGANLTRLALDAGVLVTPIPGPSAALVLVQIGGFTSADFNFRGFFPRTKKAREQELENFSQNDWSENAIWFESPQRILEALSLIAEVGKSEAWRLLAGKELTKIHERIFSGSPAAVLAAVSEEISREGARGEWCFSISKIREKNARPESPNSGEKFVKKETQSSDWVKVLHCLLSAGVSASVAARRVSHDFGAPRKEAYASAVKLSQKKTTGGD